MLKEGLKKQQRGFQGYLKHVKSDDSVLAEKGRLSEEEHEDKGEPVPRVCSGGLYPVTRNVLWWRSSQIKISAALEIDFINQSSDWRADSYLRSDV